jgi:TP901 family phage tail tape measure protein
MASREKVTFKIDLDSSAFVNGLKKAQGVLNNVAQESKKASTASGKLQVALVELVAGFSDLYTSANKSGKSFDDQVKRLKTLIKDYSRYEELLQSLNQEEKKNSGLDDRLVKLAQISDKYKELIKLAGQKTSSERGEEAIFQYEKDDDKKIMRARIELERLNDALIKIRPFADFFKKLTTNIGTGLSNALKRAQQGTQELKRAFSLMRNVMSQTIDSVRQITQGFLSMGRALTFFVAIPFTAWLKESIQSATEFESAMARVTKVAGFDQDEFGVPDIGGPQSQELNQFIRDISEVAGSSQNQFAQWAEDLAQFGVDSVDALKDYLPMMEMMASGTDVAATDVAKRLGNVANAFGFAMSDMEGDARNYVWRMINVINDLENNVGASADQILTAVEASGPTLSQLGVPGYVVASWSALGIEAGLSADEVGTGLRNLGSFMSRNFVKAFDDGQTALKDLFGTAEEMHKQMREDFAGTFTTILDYYSKEEDNVKVIAELYDFLGNRAGKLAAALVQAALEGSDGATRLLDVMEQAEKQFKNPISLAQEYQAVQKTLAHQTQQLKNTFTNLSLAVGDSLIPELKKLVQAAIPVVKTMANLFAGLDDGTKRLIFFGSAIVAISGPILFFVSQMAFGASLIMSGLIKLGGVLGTITKVFGVFGMQLLKLNPVAWLFAGSVSRAFGMVRDAGLNTVDTLGNIFGGLAKMMPRWGQGIFDGLADGIEGSAARIAKAVNMIAQIISSFFEAHSPPDTGPLQHIDKWGTTLFDTYLEGFAKADFGILKDVAGYIEHILSSWIDIGKLDDDGNMEAMLLQFRQDFAGLLSQFNEFGRVADSAISAVTERFGEASDEIFKLIKLNFQLKSIIEDIEGVEKRKKEVTQAYRDQVRDLMKSNMSLEEQAQLLGQLQQERDKDLAILDEEQEMLEARKDAAQEELDFQKQLLDAYKDQDDIFADMLKAMEDIKDALGGAGGGLSDFELEDIDAEFELEGMAEAQEAMASFSEAMANLNGQALKLELTLRTVFGTIGRKLQSLATDNMGEIILKSDGMKERLTSFAETGLKSISTLESGTKDYNKVVQDMVDIFGKNFMADFFDDMELNDTTLDSTGVKTQAIVDALEEMDDVDLAGFTKAIQNAEGDTDDAFSSMTKLGEGVGELFDAVMLKIEPLYKKIRAFFLALSGQEVDDETMTMTVDGDEVDIAGIDELVNLGHEINQIFAVLEERLPKILGLVGQIGDNVLSGLGIDLVADDISGNVDSILGAIQTFLEKVASIDKPVRMAIGLFLAINAIKTAFQVGGTSLIAPIIKGLLALGKGGLRVLISSVGAVPLTISIPVGLALLITGIAIKKEIKRHDDLREGYAESIRQAAENAKLKYDGEYIYSEKFLEVLIPYRAHLSRMAREGMITDEEFEAWAHALQNYDFASQGLDNMTGVDVPVPIIPEPYIDMRAEDAIAKAMQDALDRLKFSRSAAGDFTAENMIADAIEQAGNAVWGATLPDANNAGQEAGKSYLDGVTTALSQPVELKSIQDIENWAQIFGITPEQLLTEDFEGVEAITIPAPTLAFDDTIVEEVRGLVEQIVSEFNTLFGEADFALTETEGASMAQGIVDGLLAAFSVTTIKAETLYALATNMAGALFNAFAQGGNAEAIAMLQDVGLEWARIISESMDAELFDPKNALSNFVTIVTDLKTASTGLDAGFSMAQSAIEKIIGYVGDGTVWKTFVSDVATLGGEGVGSFGFAFVQGYTEADNLKTFLEGDFLTALDRIVALFNSLMSGNWSIKVSVIYESLNKWQTGGSAIPGNFGTVGETGTEFFAPPIRGHVTSHSELSSILSGGGKETKKEINMNITGSPVQMTEDELMRMLRRVEFLYG